MYFIDTVYMYIVYDEAVISKSFVIYDISLVFKVLNKCIR